MARAQLAAIGFSSHSGWAALVCLGGAPPALIERSRLLLTTSPLPREPYHDAKRGGLDKAEGIVAAAGVEARALAAEAIAALTDSLEAQGYKLVAGGVVLGGGRPGVTLPQALSTHAAMHGAEGWLFREALIEAVQKCGLSAIAVPERELLPRAAALLATSEQSVSALLQQLGRDHGPPWGRDQKAATMAALAAMHSGSERARRPD